MTEPSDDRAFFEWLTQRMALSTAALYARAVTRVIRDVPNLREPEALENYIVSGSLRLIHVLQPAWRRYVEFRASIGDTNVPRITHHKTTRRRVGEGEPPEFAHAVAAMVVHAEFKPRHLISLRWSDVQQYAGDCVYVQRYWGGGFAITLFGSSFNAIMYFASRRKSMLPNAPDTTPVIFTQARLGEPVSEDLIRRMVASVSTPLDSRLPRAVANIERRKTVSDFVWPPAGSPPPAGLTPIADLPPPAGLTPPAELTPPAGLTPPAEQRASQPPSQRAGVSERSSVTKPPEIQAVPLNPALQELLAKGAPDALAQHMVDIITEAGLHLLLGVDLQPIGHVIQNGGGPQTVYYPPEIAAPLFLAIVSAGYGRPAAVRKLVEDATQTARVGGVQPQPVSGHPNWVVT